jgi:hypothetical protein
MSASRSVLLLRLCCPNEKREGNTDREPPQSVQMTRKHIVRQLTQFREHWMLVGKDKHYAYMHSTLTIAGAVLYALGLNEYSDGPVSPAAYFVLQGLQYAAAAQNTSERENRRIKVEDFLRDYRFQEHDAVRLRPGWKFMKPVSLRENH